ncbi:MAG: alpha/beta hydrolase [Gemmataceae bacterium]|nr:alpha/beta hydrolase [Gemmataceae bacterium]
MPPRGGAAMLVATDVGQGPVVVLLHAFPLSRAMWRPQIDALRDLYRVIAPDLPGFGDSSLPAASSIDGYADAVAEMLDDKDIHSPVIVGGLSMGGYAALAFARRHPHRVAGLVLADTRAEADDATARANRDKLIAQARSGPSSAIVEAMLPKLMGKDAPPELVEAVRELGSAQKPATLAAALGALRDRPDATPGLAGIRVPALVIVGQDDALTPPDLARKLAGGIQGAKLAIIDKAGHLSSLEQPGAFNDVLMAFLAGVAQE